MINFWLCQGFTTSLIGEINKVQTLVHAQKKSVYAYKQVRLVKHATIDEALSITMHSLAGSTHDEVSKDIVKWSLILCWLIKYTADAKRYWESNSVLFLKKSCHSHYIFFELCDKLAE